MFGQLTSMFSEPEGGRDNSSGPLASPDAADLILTVEGTAGLCMERTLRTSEVDQSGLPSSGQLDSADYSTLPFLTLQLTESSRFHGRILLSFSTPGLPSLPLHGLSKDPVWELYDFCRNWRGCSLVD